MVAKKDRKLRARGFNEFNKVIRDTPSLARSVANCKSCIFNNLEDECTNASVSSYDMVEDGNKTYCSYWQGEKYDNGRKKDPFDW